MREELEIKLNEKFSFYNKSNNMDPFSMFGFEVGDGWFDLIWNLSVKIQTEYNKMTDEQKEDFAVLQVKEKFGGLRYYISSYTEEMDDAVTEAENQSYSICEICGNPGKLNSAGWLKVRCEEHWNE